MVNCESASQRARTHATEMGPSTGWLLKDRKFRLGWEVVIVGRSHLRFFKNANFQEEKHFLLFIHTSHQLEKELQADFLEQCHTL